MKPVSIARADFERTIIATPLEVAALAKDARLKGVDVKSADLDGDGKIGGAKEAAALFDVLDKLDTDKSRRSLELVDGEGKATPMRARMSAIEDVARTGAYRKNGPGAPPANDAVKNKQRYPVDTGLAFAQADANKTQGNKLVREYLVAHNSNYTKLADWELIGTLGYTGKTNEVFDKITTRLEAAVAKGTMTKGQAEAVLLDLFTRMMPESRDRQGLLDRFRKSALSEPVRNRDTDGDGVRDLDEIRKGTNVYENTRITASGGRDTVEERRNALADAIHNPVRANPKSGEGTHQTWIGDQGTAFDKKNGGYVYFTPKSATSPADAKSYTIPDKLDVGGVRATVKVVSATEFEGGGSRTAFLVNRDGVRLVATPRADGKLDFWAPTNTMQAGAITVDGKYYLPWVVESAKRTDVAIAFNHAYASANSGRARVSPDEHDLRTLQFAESRRGETLNLVKQLDAQTKKSIEASIGWIESSNKQLGVDSEKFIAELKDLGPLVAGGYLKVDLDEATGKTTLTLVQGDLKAKDFQKLKDKFGEKVKAYQTSMSEKSEKLANTIRAREAHAAEYLRYASSSDFTTYLESLKPEDRTAEMAKLSKALVGTKAGQELADDLAMGLRDRSLIKHSITRMIVDEPTPRSDATKNNMSVVAQVAAASSKFLPDQTRHEVFVHLTTGHAATAEEKQVIKQLLDAQETVLKMHLPTAEAQQSALMGLMDRVIKNAGPASHVLHVYAHPMQHAREHAVAHGHHIPADAKLPPAKMGQKGLMIGAAGFAAVSFGMSLSHAVSHPSLGTIAHAAVEGVNFSVMLAGTAEAFMGRASPFLKGVGKFGGPIVATAHLVTDIVHYGDKHSPEGKDAAVMNIAGSAALLGGALLASNPIGWALAGGGLLLKLFADDTDPRYEDAYGKLKELPYR